MQVTSTPNTFDAVGWEGEKSAWCSERHCIIIIIIIIIIIMWKRKSHCSEGFTRSARLSLVKVC